MAVYQPRSESATTSVATPNDVDGLKAELAREQERLRKLWDAFKSQEDELARLRKTGGPALQSTGATAADARNAEAYKREVDLLAADLRRAAENQRRLEDENRHLSESAGGHADTARRVPQLEGELEQERERLAKLYAVYEEVEAARQALESRLKEWDAWYHGVSPHLAEICRSIGGAPHSR